MARTRASALDGLARIVRSARNGAPACAPCWAPPLRWLVIERVGVPRARQRRKQPESATLAKRRGRDSNPRRRNLPRNGFRVRRMPKESPVFIGLSRVPCPAGRKWGSQRAYSSLAGRNARAPLDAEQHLPLDHESASSIGIIPTRNATFAVLRCSSRSTNDHTHFRSCRHARLRARPPPAPSGNR